MSAANTVEKATYQDTQAIHVDTQATLVDTTALLVDTQALILSRAGGLLGTPVPRAAAADPQNVWLPLFTVAGGHVLMTSLLGVRTVIQAGGVSNMQFRHSVGPTVLCAVGIITANAVATLYNITGNVADALQIGAAGVPIRGGLAGGLLATGINMLGFVLGAGTLDVTMTAAAGTGSTRYILHYIPLDLGAVVTAA